MRYIALMGLLGTALVAGGAAKANVAELTADDFEKIPYICRCSCFDHQASPIRVRLPGGGYGYEYQHVPLYNPRFNNYNATVDFLIQGQTADSCRRIHGNQCSGTRRAPQHDPSQVSGWLSRCYWSVNPYPENP